MRISVMQTTCHTVFCQINSSPKRKRHWVGCTWPVSMYASGLCVAAAASRRWKWNTLSLSPAIKWRSLNHASSLDLLPETEEKTCSVTSVWNLLVRNELVLYGAKEGRVFSPQHCVRDEPKSAGRLLRQHSSVWYIQNTSFGIYKWYA